jgi:2-methylcitrate dehydratase PrpD
MVLAAAGHVLDFDDTYGPGLAHLSAPTAPAALATGAAEGATVAEVLAAYAGGFEMMAALASASHPSLYERGWHPTAVTGTVGAATAAASILGLDRETLAAAQRLALLAAAGLRAAFGTEGKSLQVGMAAANGAAAARLAAAGASTGDRVQAAFAEVYGGTWREPGPDRAIEHNWIKAFPCCLQTHSSIEAAERARAAGAGPEGVGIVTVHPRSRQAAPLDDVTTGLEAKFSIPYTVAFTMLHGPPGGLADFGSVDPAARTLAARVRIELDDGLAESAARLEWQDAGAVITTEVDAALGSPQRPLSDTEHAAKIRRLVGERFDGMLDDLDRPASELLDLALQP